MTLAQDFEDFVKLLNKHQVDYMVVGGYALAFHGKPRHTGDLDIWINSSEANAEKLVIAIKEFPKCFKIGTRTLISGLLPLFEIQITTSSG